MTKLQEIEETNIILEELVKDAYKERNHLKESFRVQNAIMITLMEIINETNIGTSVEMTEERINSAAKNYALKSDFNDREKILKITLMERSDEDENSNSPSATNEEEQPADTL